MIYSIIWRLYHISFCLSSHGLCYDLCVGPVAVFDLLELM